MAGIGFNVKATGNETANQVSLVPHPLSSVNYCESYSRANREHLNGLMLGEMSPAHASKQKKNRRSSFPHKAQDKINPTDRFKAKMSASWLLFLCYHIYRL